MRLTALLNIRYAPRDFKVYHSGLGKYTTGIHVSMNVVRILNILSRLQQSAGEIPQEDDHKSGVEVTK